MLHKFGFRTVSISDIVEGLPGLTVVFVVFRATGVPLAVRSWLITVNVASDPEWFSISTCTLSSPRLASALAGTA